MFSYRKEIDGLRAIAIIPVIFFHAGFQGFSGGFVGVDIFFVISGYLISSIIFKEHIAGTFTLKNFYERRARRILPALFLVSFASIPLAFAWMTPADMLDFSESLVAVPLFASNFLFYMESGYFDAAMEVKPLFHTWSLGVEEQFYMLFPLLMIYFWKHKPKNINKIIIILFLCSIILSELTVHIDRMFAFFMLPTRIWELSLGISIALLELYNKTPKYSKATKNIISALGLILISGSIYFFDDKSPVPGLYALVPTIGASLIILFSNSILMGSIIGNRLFVGIGLISYSAYLWHQPLFAFLRIYRFGDIKFGQLASGVLITFILAFITWKFIEKPFRDRSNINYKTLLISLITAGALLVSIGVTGIATNGFEKIYELRLTPQEQAFFKNAKEIAELRNRDSSEDSYPNCYLSYSESDEFYLKFSNCINTHGPATILMGDSHMFNVKKALNHTNKFSFIVTVNGYHCHPYHKYEKESISKCNFDDISIFLRKQSHNIDFLLYNQLGSYFLMDEDKDTLNHKSVSYVSTHDMSVSRERISNILKYFDEISQNIPVIWLASWIEPRYSMNNPRKVARYGIDTLDYIPNVINMFDQVDQEIDQQISSHNNNIKYIKLYDRDTKKNFISIIENDCVAFNDKDHLSRCGEKIAGPIFSKKINDALLNIPQATP